MPTLFNLLRVTLKFREVEAALLLPRFSGDGGGISVLIKRPAT